MNSHADFDDINELARFCAELTRQEIRFTAAWHNGLYRVTITGW